MKERTAIEGIAADGIHVVWNRDGRKLCAAIEGILTYGLKEARQGERRNLGTAIESIVGNGLYGVWKTDRREVGTVLESAVVNADDSELYVLGVDKRLWYLNITTIAVCTAVMGDGSCGSRDIEIIVYVIENKIVGAGRCADKQKEQHEYVVVYLHSRNRLFVDNLLSLGNTNLATMQLCDSLALGVIHVAIAFICNATDVSGYVNPLNAEDTFDNVGLLA